MKDKRMTIYQMTTTALMTAVLCVLGPISVPIGAVPVSFTMVAVYFAVYVLGAKYATISTLLYLVIGSIGLPVFSGYEGGLAKLAGPTGGYLIGFAVIAVIAGIIIDHFGGENRLEHRRHGAGTRGMLPAGHHLVCGAVRLYRTGGADGLRLSVFGI